MNDLPDRPASPDIINDLNNILSIEQIKKILLQTTYDVLTHDDADTIQLIFVLLFNKLKQLEHKIKMLELHNDQKLI
jgi:hypothetical protein